MIQFGSYVFGVGWSCTNDDDEQTLPMAAIPRAQGGAFLVAQRKPRSWTVEGGFTTAAGLPNVASGTVRDAVDGLKAALFAGPSNFSLDTDRYWRNVQVEEAPTDWSHFYNLFGTLQLKLTGPDPYAYSTTVTTTAELAGPNSYTLALGNAFALPVWFLRANLTLNASFDWDWTNTTTGETFNLQGAWPISGAGYLAVDSLHHQVWSYAELGGSPTPGPAAIDLTTQANAFGLFEGQMPRLQQGTNHFTLAQHVAGVTGAWATFAARFL